MRLDRLVSSNERVHLVTREHGVVLLRPFARSLAAVLLFGGGAYETAASPAPTPLRWAAAVLAAIVVTFSMIGLLKRVLRWNARRLVITDRRVLLTSGTLSRRISSVPVDALNDLQIHLSGSGRLLRYGSVIVSAGGRQGPLLGVRRLPQPDLVFALLLGIDPPRSTTRRPLVDRERALESAL